MGLEFCAMWKEGRGESAGINRHRVEQDIFLHRDPAQDAGPGDHAIRKLFFVLKLQYLFDFSHGNPLPTHNLPLSSRPMTEKVFLKPCPELSK